MPGFEKFGDAERKEVQDVLDSGVLMRYGFDTMRHGHWKSKSLETELQHFFKVNHAHVLSSGTAALTVALACAGVGAGDEVIMPSFTFVASFEAILMLGAIPKVVDIDDTLGLCPKAVEKAITPKTKAIMVVQMCGSMARMDEIRAVANKHELKLVEDACQSIGGSYKGEKLGTLGDIGCFSFDFVKTMTCGEGGAVITNHKAYYENAHQYTDHGHDHIGNDRGAEHHHYLGYNFRISELNAAVGLAQLKRLPEFLELQKRNYNILKGALSQIQEVTFRTVPEGGEESCAFLNFYLPSLDIATNVASEFKANGVDACFHYYNNNWHYIRKWEHLKEAKSLYPLSDEIITALNALSQKDFSQSDHYISRNISCLIKLSWSEIEAKERAFKMVECVKRVLESSLIS